MIKLKKLEIIIRNDFLIQILNNFNNIHNFLLQNNNYNKINFQIRLIKILLAKFSSEKMQILSCKI